MISKVVGRFGRIDALVNNAGVVLISDIESTEENDFDRVVNVNYKGAFFCSRYAVEAMMRAGGGSVVNIGSAHAWAGSKDLAAYSVAKGALHTLTGHVAKNYADQGIRANWITVGWVETPGELARAERLGRSAEWLRAEGARRVPLGRLQTEEDIAWAAVYLLSDESAQVTGTDIHVSGGFLP
jgi:NAD(P)-dependent dehydrogenase (short-subunit alcohol dehydrogenase family)